ncbi:(2Fe-2S)-binding protein [Marinobacteraceae bacterium S3BR75-40.1]
MAITLNVNGTRHELEVAKGTPLLWVLRDRLGLTGTKYGCGVAQCGACTVHVNGQPRRACVTPVENVGEAEVRTIEGVKGEVADAVRTAWQDIDVPQCGYCQAGQIMSAVALLESVPNPDDEDIDRGMAGNICRCATYMRIRRAIKNAAKGTEA